MMMRDSVSRRLLAITVGVTVLAVALAGGVLLRHHRRSLVSGLESGTVILAKTVAEHCVLPLYFEDAVGAGEILAKLEPSAVVGRAALFDRKGRVIASYQQPGHDPPNVSLRQAPAMEHAGGYLHIWEPVLHRGAPQGTLYLAASTASVRGQTRNDLLVVLLASLAATALAVALAWMLQRSVTRPILRLAATMRGITGQTMLTTRVEHPGHDELGVLYRGFNGMLDQLAAQTAERDRSESRLRALLAALPDPVFVLDHRGFIAEVLAGGDARAPSAVEARGKTIEQVTAPDRAGDFADAIARALGTRSIQRIAYETDGKSGKRWFDAVLLPIRTAATTLEAHQDLVLFVPRDVTERHTLELDLRQLQKMDALGRLAGGVAHDFNNILTAIMGYGSLLSDRLRSEGGDLTEAEEILKASERAALLTQQLLAFSRRQVVEPSRLSLNELVRDIQRMLERIIGEDVQLVADLAPALADVHVDVGQIQQVILNLAVNAREAMPGGGTLTLRTRGLEVRGRLVGGPDLSAGRYVMLEVTDTGVGMDEAVRARIFEPFFTTKGRKGGTGLGLAMVYGIVRQASGDVLVVSEPDRGTTFRIYLPEAPAGAAAGAIRPRPLPHALPRGNESLLVVEDEPQLLELTCRMLRDQGYQVMGASDAHQALQICAVTTAPIHLMVTDIVMPRMRGTELAQAVRPLRPEMKVLFMSGYTDSPNLSGGAGTAFLQKPFTNDELSLAVRAVLAYGAEPAAGGGEIELDNGKRASD